MELLKSKAFKKNSIIPLLLVAGFFILSSSSQNTEYKNLHKLKWIVGKWKTKSEQNLQFEEWEKISDIKFSGKSFKVVSTDTIVLETLQLIIENGDIYYIPTVLDQNNALPIRFKLVLLEKNKAVFENLNHDFPKKIQYALESKKEIKATVSNESFSIDFHLSKQKKLNLLVY